MTDILTADADDERPTDGQYRRRSARPRLMGDRYDALHPIVRAAAKGELPDWVVMSRQRLAHAERVARLMRKWAKARGLSKSDRARWSAAGYLHDGLKGVRPSTLRKRYDVPRDYPDPTLHGPACAARLEKEGVGDRALLRAISHHTTGHPKLDVLGCSLYMADYLDPGRGSRPIRRQRLRSRLPEEHDDVLIEIAASKMQTLLDRRLRIPKVTVEFWAMLTERS